MDRAAKIAKARELRAKNLTCREIAERLGLTKSQVWEATWDVEIPRECPGCGADLTQTHGRTKWCSDGCRKDTLYAGSCIDCGGPTDGVKSGFARPAVRCIECARSQGRERNELLREMWDAGEPTWHIAQTLGTTESSVLSQVQMWRRQGEALSLRRLGGDEAERRRRHLRMIKLRRRGLSNAEIIAAAVGMASAASVSASFLALRQKGWAVPPAPRPTASGRREAAA